MLYVLTTRTLTNKNVEVCKKMADLKDFTKIFVTLLVIVAVIGVVFLVSAKLEDSLCEAANSDYEYSGDTCYTNSSLTTDTELDSITQMQAVKTNVTLGVTLLGIVVLIMFIVPMIKKLQGINKGGM